jgi:hypothetical protein
VRDRLARLFETSGCNYMIGAFAWGTMSHDESVRSMRLFVEAVMPRFRRGGVV